MLNPRESLFTEETFLSMYENIKRIELAIRPDSGSAALSSLYRKKKEQSWRGKVCARTPLDCPSCSVSLLCWSHHLFSCGPVKNKVNGGPFSR
jgi:hypothetical protein